jgi:hypothetical protein
VCEQVNPEGLVPAFGHGVGECLQDSSTPVRLAAERWCLSIGVQLAAERWCLSIGVLVLVLHVSIRLILNPLGKLKSCVSLLSACCEVWSWFSECM